MNRTEMRPELRERVLEAMLRELGEKGQEGLSVATVLSGLDVSAEEFAGEFQSLDACLDAAYEDLTARLAGVVRTRCAEDRPSGSGVAWPDRVRVGLEALLAELAGDPARARALTGVYPSLGPTRQRRYQAFVESFAVQLRARRELGGIVGELPGDVDSLAVGAAEAIVFEEIASGRTEALPEMTPSILFSVLVPFLGPDRAIAEMEKARQQR